MNAPAKKTAEQRSVEVRAAIRSLPAAWKAAAESGDPADWEKVEKLGAIVHRQGRLLAGKKKGG